MNGHGTNTKSGKRKMSSAYIPKKDRYDTVLTILKEQIDEYFNTDSDLNQITGITTWQSDGGQDLAAEMIRVLTNRKSRIMKGIYHNCQLISIGEGEPAKEEEKNE